MTYYAALSFSSYEDFELCNTVMNIKSGDTATSSDGMFTVLVRTELQLPPGKLKVKTKQNKDIQVRLLSGKQDFMGMWTAEGTTPNGSVPRRPAPERY